MQPVGGTPGGLPGCRLHFHRVIWLNFVSATSATVAGWDAQGGTMIVLFTDFGLHGPYTGQMKAALHQMAPAIPVIDLFADAPAGNPKASAYLLAAYAGWFPAGTVFLCVVDPGVGGARPAIILEADARWYVGPGNGLFELVQRRAGKRAAGTSTGTQSASRRAFTGATSLHRSQRCSRAANRHPAGRALMRRIAGRTGQMTSARSFTSTISAMP
jgi:hypothetical protein